MTMRSRVNAFVIVFVGLGMPTYYKIKFLLLEQITLEQIVHWTLLLDVSFSFLLSALIVLGHDRVVRFLKQRFSQGARPFSRLILQFLATSLFAMLAAYVFTRFFWDLLLGIPTTSEYLFDFILLALFIPVFVNGVTESLYYYGEWEEASVKKEILRRENIKARYEILKNQINPHFLFNSFNTLSELINESRTLAVQFLEQLSNVYRFILESRETEVVALDTELDMLESYVFLLQMRFGEKLRFNLNVAREYLHHAIAPMTLQILLENAIKHNVASVDAPLTIDVSVSDDHILIFRNNLQKQEALVSTGVGLQNIINRYQYLTTTPVDIRETPTEFIVRVPLMNIAYV